MGSAVDAGATRGGEEEAMGIEVEAEAVISHLQMPSRRIHTLQILRPSTTGR